MKIEKNQNQFLKYSGKNGTGNVKKNEIINAKVWTVGGAAVPKFYG